MIVIQQLANEFCPVSYNKNFAVLLILAITWSSIEKSSNRDREHSVKSPSCIYPMRNKAPNSMHLPGNKVIHWSIIYNSGDTKSHKLISHPTSTRWKYTPFAGEKLVCSEVPPQSGGIFFWVLGRLTGCQKNAKLVDFRLDCILLQKVLSTQLLC